MNEPPVFVYNEAVIFWIMFIWIFVLEIQHSGIVAGDPGNKQDAGTLLLLNIINNIALALAFVSSFLPGFVIPFPRTALHVGTALIITGFLLRRYSFHALGEYFTAAVKVSENQPVIDKGPYRWIRHPGYMAGFLIFLGIGCSLGNWISIAIFIVSICTAYYYRIKAEEKALLETLGEPYREYMSRTKRFIPVEIDIR